MARYKVLPSIAHNFAQAFVGASQARQDDHLLGHLLFDAKRVHEPQLRFDIMTGVAEPEKLVSRPLRSVLERYAREFPALVTGHHSSMEYVTAARMELSFDFAAERTVATEPPHVESPYVCRVTIEDDRGKAWVAELHGWCTPEPHGLLSRLTGRH